MRDLVSRKDLDMTAIERRIQLDYTEMDASVIAESIADAMLDGIDILMTVDEWSEEHTYCAVECWMAQLKKYGLENDKFLLDMVDDAFLYLSIEAGCRDMESIDPSQYL